jgi:hypothetical protein
MCSSARPCIAPAWLGIAQTRLLNALAWPGIALARLLIALARFRNRHDVTSRRIELVPE